MNAEPIRTWTTVQNMFSEIAEVSNMLWKARKGEYCSHEDYIIEELSRRCWQLKWGLELIEEAYFAWNCSSRPDKPEYIPPDYSNLNPEEWHKHFWLGMKKTEYLCDAFYATAFRIFDMVREHKSLSFEARGVVLVRNLLIIHPDKKQGSMRFNFSGYGDFPGPAYKGRHMPGQEPYFMDPGLLINALEFGANLLEKMKTYDNNAK